MKSKEPKYEDFTEEEIELIEKLGGLEDIHKFWTNKDDEHLLVTCIGNGGDKVSDMMVCGIFPDGMPFMMPALDFVSEWKAVEKGEKYNSILKEFQTYAKFFMEYVDE